MATEKVPPYAIRAVGTGRVEVVSESPLQFEAKGWQRGMRSEIRRSVARLVAGPEDVLVGVYAGPTGAWRVDAENVLFYNVGTGAFAGSASRGLRFERVHGPASSIGTDRRFSHAATYEPAPIDGGFRFVQALDGLAAWEGVAVAASDGSPSGTEVWAAMRDVIARSALADAVVRVDRPGFYGGSFALRLRVSTPLGPTNSASLVKPLIDGVTAAFSAHDGVDLDGVSRRIGEALRRPPDRVAEALTTPSPMLLGTQRLVVCRSRGVQWLPPDDRCLACELIVEREPSPTWRLSGSLAVAQPVRGPAGAAGAPAPRT